MQQLFTHYRFFLPWWALLLLSTTCTQDRSDQNQTVHAIAGDHSAISETKLPFSTSYQRPAGIPNTDGSCYINAVLQVIAAFYGQEVKAYANRALRAIIEKINHTSHSSIPEADIKLFKNSLPKATQKPSPHGGDPVQFLDALHTLSPFLPEITATIRIFRHEQGVIKGSAFKLLMPFIFLYPPFDQGFKMEPPIFNDLTRLIQSNQEVVVCHPTLLTNLCEPELLEHADELDSTDLPPFVLQYRHWLAGFKGASKPIIIQYVYSELPDKLAIAFTRPGSKGSKIYDYRDLHGTEVVDIYNGAMPTRFKLAAFISAVTQVGPKPDHAIAFVKRAEQWYYVSDEVVLPISRDVAIQASKQARVLFYHKIK